MIYSNSTIAIPPGATIREQLEDRGITQKEFASRMGMSEKHISHLINGKSELTQDVALRLESVFGIPARFWNNLESSYRESIERVNAENAMESDLSIAQKMPYSKMAKLGWVEATRELKQKVMHLRAFFEVARLDLLDTLQIPGIAYRKVGANETSDYALAAWAQKARIEARKIDCKPISTESLAMYISDIRSMTTKAPSVFCKELVERMAEHGVALVFLPHIQGSFLHGATFCDADRIVMGLTVRGKDADKFWFSFMHEAHHAIGKHINSKGETNKSQEEEADCFARDMLIPPAEYKTLLQQPMTKENIVSFAKEIGIDPGIVVGRLQKDKKIPFSQYNDLKTRYQIAE